MSWFKRKKKVEEMTNCEYSEVMEGAMSIQGNALVSQTELNVVYQTYSLLRWKDGYTHAEAVNEAADVLEDLEDAINKRKRELSHVE